MELEFNKLNNLVTSKQAKSRLGTKSVVMKRVLDIKLSGFNIIDRSKFCLIEKGASQIYGVDFYKVVFSLF